MILESDVERQEILVLSFEQDGNTNNKKKKKLSNKDFMKINKERKSEV